MKTVTLPIFLGLSLLLAPLTSSGSRFPGAGGNYGGILEAGSFNDPDNSGLLVVFLNDSGTASIRLVWQGQVYGLASVFNNSGQLIRKFRKKNAPAGTELELFCALNTSGRTIDGVLNDPVADSGSPLSQGFSISGAAPDPALTEQLAPGLRVSFIEPDSTAAITEDGFGVVFIGNTARRATRIVGRLPDNSPYSTGSPLRGDKYALRAGLYGQPGDDGAGGQLLGLGDVDAGSGAAPESAPESAAPRGGGSVASLVAALRWHKRRNLARARAYPDGFDQRVDFNAAVYSRSRDLSLVLGGQARVNRTATLRLSNGNLGTAAAPGPNPINVGVNVTFLGARVLSPNPHRVTLAVNPFAARFTGTFRHPDTGEVMRFRGAFSSFSGVTPGEGRGTFLSLGPAPRTDPALATSGSVRITLN